MRSESKLKSRLSTVGLLVLVVVFSFLLAQLAIAALSSTQSPTRQPAVQNNIDDSPNIGHSELIAMPVHVSADALDAQGLSAGDRVEVLAVARGGRSGMPWESVISNVAVLAVASDETIDPEAGNLRMLTLEMTGQDAATVAFAAETGDVRIRRLR